MRRLGTPLAVVLFFGCASDKQTDAPNDAPRGQRRMGDEQQPAAAPAAAPAPAEPQTVVATQTAKPVEQAKPPEKEKRDYSAELRAALGSPVHCLKPRSGSDVPKEIVIDVDATVVELGLVTRAYVRSSQLDDTEIECVQRQLATLRLRAPIEGAPRNVPATIKLELQPAQNPAPAPANAYGEGSEPPPPGDGTTAPAPPAQ